MRQIIQEQIYFQITTLCAGMFLMFGYDILRLWRWLIPHGKIWVWVEDLLYWSLSGIPVFILFFRMIDGVPRWYGIAGSIGVLAFNGVIGGLIGGIIVIARMIAVFVEIIKMIAGAFGHDVQKCDRRDIM